MLTATQLTELLDTVPEGTDEAVTATAGFDTALCHGLARVGEEQAAALSALAAAVGATPLGPAAAEAAAAVTAGTLEDGHLAALAAARTALLGAVHDAHLGTLDAVTGRRRDPWPEAPAAPAAPGDGPVVHALAGCRAWLRELAITGWRGVGEDLLPTADGLVESLMDAPGLRGLAVLIDGLTAEIRACSPVSVAERLPVRRWADLWARALVASQPAALPAPAPAAESVSGRLLLLGADIHEHPTAFRVQVHAVLEPAGGAPARLVRASVAAAKVDMVTGPAVWELLGNHPVLLGALGGRLAVDITDMPLLPGGDLLWHDDRAAAGEPADPLATARVLLPGAVAPPVRPLDRHPVRLAEPVLVEGYKSDGKALRFGDTLLEFDLERLPACGPLTPQLLKASTACIGLLRRDAGRWLLQPLGVGATVKRQPVDAHSGDWATGVTDPKAAKAAARHAEVLPTLRERAGRLLRK
ncbi:hypothetical protein [Streptomyces sp. RFCAC02]|uniref:hypothetical protein n=1 Tax=Streptomyces sp. RFCAC02 TaxID=2499143 RepID=UPI00102017DA|nr:hypothetical protein [Streptomyces sp. RFCAC02]